MIFYENFANFYDFSTNFCQLADFLPEGGGPPDLCKIFTSVSMGLELSTPSVNPVTDTLLAT